MYDNMHSPDANEKLRPEPSEPCGSEAALRAILAGVLKGCRTKSRAQIADELTRATGRPVSQSMLDELCSESKQRLRVPLSWVRPICEMTGNNDLAIASMPEALRERAEIGALVLDGSGRLEEAARRAAALRKRERTSKSATRARTRSK
jgi:hypothetical protein